MPRKNRKGCRDESRRVKRPLHQTLRSVLMRARIGCLILPRGLQFWREKRKEPHVKAAAGGKAHQTKSQLCGTTGPQSTFGGTIARIRENTAPSLLCWEGFARIDWDSETQLPAEPSCHAVTVHGLPRPVGTFLSS